MTHDLKLLKRFVEKFIGTVRFRNDHFTAITGYGHYVHGNITICHVYYVEGLGHNLFSVGQFCDGAYQIKFVYNLHFRYGNFLSCLLDVQSHFNKIMVMVLKALAPELWASLSRLDPDVVAKVLTPSFVIQIVMWIVDSGCSKHMIGNLKLLKSFIEKFIGTVCFGNDHFAAITGYGHYVHGNITICHVYYIDCLGHNLFSVGQFCDGDLEVAFRSKTWYVRNMEGDGLLTGAHQIKFVYNLLFRYGNLFSCLLDVQSHFNKITVMAPKALAPELCKSKKATHLPKLVPGTHSKLELTHMDLCGPKRIESIKWKKAYFVIKIVLWIVDSGCSKHMIGDLKLLKNFVEKFIDMVCFGNDHFAAITGYVEGLGHNLFSVGQFCDEEISPISNDEANELIQEEDSAYLDGNTLFSPYHTPMFEEAESSSIAEYSSNLKVTIPIQPTTHIWTKAHPLDQVIANPSRPVMTRSRLITDSNVCLYTLTMSSIKPKNIKEAMSYHS
ncbi:hypothetical protein Tco_0032948 [Tanacetum coccineum]